MNEYTVLTNIGNNDRLAMTGGLKVGQKTGESRAASKI